MVRVVVNIWPKSRVLRCHKEMWNDIADSIEKCKRVIDIEKAKSDFCRSNGFDVTCDCFLCEYSRDLLCADCPVMWGDDPGDVCTVLHDGGLGLYPKVKSASSWEEQAALARKIANLPERQVLVTN